MSGACPAPLVEVRAVGMRFDIGGTSLFGGRRLLTALDGVDLTVDAREIVGLIGESGSGKSTLGRCLLRIHKPSVGAIAFDGEDIGGLDGEGLRRFRQRSQMIFQDPSTALNPRMTVGATIHEHLRNQRYGAHEAIEARVAELFDAIGMSAAMRERFPHELSGGQRQRVVIARAIATNPDFVVADEPVSALDVSVRAQILNLIRQLQERLGLAILFISHDLSVIAHVSQRIAVMYLGRIVELADRETLFRTPMHPYTHALLSAVPIADPVRERSRRRIVLQGEIPSPLDLPPGCSMHRRCPRASDICKRVTPELTPMVAGHLAACHHPGPQPAQALPPAAIGA
jgi:oligopeptide/dipeptide ABC transporter ATP-binding protein